MGIWTGKYKVSGYNTRSNFPCHQLSLKFYCGELHLNDEYLKRATEVIPENMILINGAAKRSRELARGAAPLVPTFPGQNNLDVALLEISEGKIVVEVEE